MEEIEKAMAHVRGLHLNFIEGEGFEKSEHKPLRFMFQQRLGEILDETIAEARDDA